MLVIQMSDGRDEILNPYSCPKYQIKIIIGVQGLNNQHWKRSSKEDSKHACQLRFSTCR